MSSNSIQKFLTEHNGIASIRLQLSADIHKEMSFIIVEGIDDVKFFVDKIVKDSVKIEESTSGKPGVISIIDKVTDSRVIGVCDRDYDASCMIPRIYYYDYANLEMMLISNDDAFKKLISEHYEGKKPITIYATRFCLVFKYCLLSESSMITIKLVLILETRCQ